MDGWRTMQSRHSSGSPTTLHQVQAPQQLVPLAPCYTAQTHSTSTPSLLHTHPPPGPHLTLSTLPFCSAGSSPLPSSPAALGSGSACAPSACLRPPGLKGGSAPSTLPIRYSVKNGWQGSGLNRSELSKDSSFQTGGAAAQSLLLPKHPRTCLQLQLGSMQQAAGRLAVMAAASAPAGEQRTCAATNPSPRAMRRASAEWMGSNSALASWPVGCRRTRQGSC